MSRFAASNDEVVVSVGDWRVDAGGPLQDLAALWLADSTAALYRSLLGATGRAPTADVFEPASLFRRHHKDHPEGAELTALLLCTDRRWRLAAGRLIRDIASQGMIDDHGLDELAELFLWSDELWFDCPVSWLDERAPADDRTVPVRRDLRPPLRRWAAERRVRRGHDDVATLVGRARALADEHGGAVVCGLLDACEDLPPDDREAAIGVGLGWSRAGVRRRALEALVGAGRPEEAARRAAGDPAALVRRWGAKLEATLAGRAQAAGRGDRRAGEGAQGMQGSLFP